MTMHTGTNDPTSDTQNLVLDLDGELNEEMEQVVSPSMWDTINPREFDGPLIAFYISLLLFLLALARALSH
jgi:hypothetical protein